MSVRLPLLHFFMHSFIPLLGISFLMTGCKTVPITEKEPDKKKGDQPASVDVGFLLTMSFGEARAISPQNIEMAPFYKIAADEITVLSKDGQGQPTRVRAKGHVFMEIEFRDKVNALGQEAIISTDEVILRGKPLLKRGRSVVEGLDDLTVFYIRGLKLQALGKHRLTNEDGVTPAWRSSWKDGPNPLLPALSPNDIHELRESVILPSITPEESKKR